MPEYQTTGINFRTLLIIMLVLVCVNIIIIALYRKYLQKEMQKDMKT